MNRNKSAGFTLLEILIALFIFTILAMLMMRSLHQIINVATRTEERAARLRDLQLTFLLMSRDIEQATNRPIINATGQEEPPFVGDATRFSLTHLGYANVGSVAHQSTLQRSQYDWHEGALWRRVSPALDQAEETKWQSRRLLDKVVAVQFEYLANDGHLVKVWPITAKNEVLPRAVKMTIRISDWGEVSQLYVIPVQTFAK